jgi:hypothetical protein
MTYPDVRSDSGLGGEWSDATDAGDDSARRSFATSVATTTKGRRLSEHHPRERVSTDRTGSLAKNFLPNSLPVSADLSRSDPTRLA